MGKRLLNTKNPDTVQKKENKLRTFLRGRSKLIVAYSGGIDSAYLAYMAYQELAEEMMAVLAVSPSLAKSEKNRAIKFLEEHQIPHRIIHTDEHLNAAYKRNDIQRCYYCKNTLFKHCDDIRRKLGYRYIAYGFNADDVADYRPGQKAAAEWNVLSPLQTALMTKKEIRLQSQKAGLSEPFRPAQPCLASRLNYGTSVTEENLMIVDKIEEFLKNLGFDLCRARFDGQTLRIEIPEEKIPQILKEDARRRIVQHARRLGISFIALDLEGFASGKMNRTFADRKRRADLEEDEIVELSANIDDQAPHVLAPALDVFLAEGALDAFFVPYYGKKGRQGQWWTILAQIEDADRMMKLMIKELGTIGVRAIKKNRKKLLREEVHLSLGHETIRAKHVVGDGIDRMHPEADELLRLAQKKGIPITRLKSLLDKEINQD